MSNEPEFQTYQDESGQNREVAKLEEDTSFELVGGGVQTVPAGNFVAKADNPNYYESYSPERFNELNWALVTWDDSGNDIKPAKPARKSASSKDGGYDG
jgi:hypothetical protein